MEEKTISNSGNPIEQANNLVGLKVNGKPIELPFIIKDKTIASTGTWTGIKAGYPIKVKYPIDAIKNIFNHTDWEDDASLGLFSDHEIGGPNTLVKDWVGRISYGSVRYVNGEIKGDLEIYDLNTAIKLQGHAKCGVSPNIAYKMDTYSNTILDGVIKNSSIVINPAMKTNYINNKDGEEEKVISMGDKVDETENKKVEEIAEKTAKLSDEDFDRIIDGVAKIVKAENEKKEPEKPPENKVEKTEAKPNAEVSALKDEIKTMKESFSKLTEALQKKPEEPKGEKKEEKKEEPKEKEEKKEPIKPEDTERVKVETNNPSDEDPDAVNKVFAEQLKNSVTGVEVE